MQIKDRGGAPLTRHPLLNALAEAAEGGGGRAGGANLLGGGERVLYGSLLYFVLDVQDFKGRGCVLLIRWKDVGLPGTEVSFSRPG